MNVSVPSGRSSWKTGLFAGLLLASLAPEAALAALYEVKIFNGATVVAMGAVDFVNGGTSGAAALTDDIDSTGADPLLPLGTSLSLATNLQAEVRDVEFSDAKSPPNLISGAFVEGLSGNVETEAGDAYSVAFSLTVVGANPDGWTKQATLTGPGPTVTNLTYSITNPLNAAPEPGVLALMATGVLLLVASRRRLAMRRNRAGAQVP